MVKVETFMVPSRLLEKEATLEPLLTKKVPGDDVEWLHRKGLLMKLFLTRKSVGSIMLGEWN